MRLMTIALGMAFSVLHVDVSFAQIAATENAAAAGKTAAQLHRIDPQTAEGLQAILTYSSTPLPIVSGHRGGATGGFPENCIETFEHTLSKTFAMLEIDPRVTRDGQTIVHHDATLGRTTTGEGRVADLSLSELKQLRLKDRDGHVTEFQIPTLDEVVKWARGKTILVLDQKDLTAVQRAQLVTEHRAEAYVILIVYSFHDIKAVHRINPNVMMEVMIPNLQKAEAFDSLRVPWRNIVAFAGHQPTSDQALYDYIHQHGTRCMVGTSRNLDKRILNGDVEKIEQLESEYRALLDRSVDLIETDIPVNLGQLLYRDIEIPPSLSAFLSKP